MAEAQSTYVDYSLQLKINDVNLYKNKWHEFVQVNPRHFEGSSIFLYFQFLSSTARERVWHAGHITTTCSWPLGLWLEKEKIRLVQDPDFSCVRSIQMASNPPYFVSWLMTPSQCMRACQMSPLRTAHSSSQIATWRIEYVQAEE